MQRGRFQTLTKHTHLNCHTLHFCSSNCPITPQEGSISLTHQLHNSLPSMKTPKWAHINYVLFWWKFFFFLFPEILMYSRKLAILCITMDSYNIRTKCHSCNTSLPPFDHPYTLCVQTTFQACAHISLILTSDRLFSMCKQSPESAAAEERHSVIIQVARATPVL